MLERAVADLPLSLRAHRVVYPREALFERAPGYWRVLTPSNPTFFWGNFLHFDAAPAGGAVHLWETVFEQQVLAAHPESQHFAACWEGTKRGAAGEFEQQGYEFMQSVVMSAERLVPAAQPGLDAQIRQLVGEADWEALIAFHLRTRDPQHSEADYLPFAQRKTAHWRRYSEAGTGAWLAAFVDGELAAALGLYAEQERGSDGVRLARYQDVITDPRWRRRGLCSALLVRAASTLEHLGVDRYLIIADEHDVARPVYAARGFRVIKHWRGLQRHGHR